MFGVNTSTVGSGDDKKTKTEFVLATTNDYRQCARLPLPENFGPVRAAFADDKHRSAIVIGDRLVCVIPLDLFEEEDEPALTLADELPRSIVLGQSVSIFPPDNALFEIVPDESKRQSRFLKAYGRSGSASLSRDPEHGPQIDGNAIRWTPSERDIGTFPIRIRVTRNQLKREWLWDVALDFDARMTSYDPVNGRLFVASDELGGMLVYNVENLLADKVAPEGTIKTDTPVTSICHKQTADGSLIAITREGSSAIALYDAGKPSDAKVEVKGSTVHCSGAGATGATRWFAAKDLKSKTSAGKDTGGQQRIMTELGWMADGAVWDPDTDKATLIVESAPFGVRSNGAAALHSSTGQSSSALETEVSMGWARIRVTRRGKVQQVLPLYVVPASERDLHQYAFGAAKYNGTRVQPAVVCGDRIMAVANGQIFDVPAGELSVEQATSQKLLTASSLTSFWMQPAQPE